MRHINVTAASRRLYGIWKLKTFLFTWLIFPFATLSSKFFFCDFLLRALIEIEQWRTQRSRKSIAFWLDRDRRERVGGDGERVRKKFPRKCDDWGNGESRMKKWMKKIAFQSVATVFNRFEWIDRMKRGNLIIDISKFYDHNCLKLSCSWFSVGQNISGLSRLLNIIQSLQFRSNFIDYSNCFFVHQLLDFLESRNN